MKRIIFSALLCLIITSLHAIAEGQQSTTSSKSVRLRNNTTNNKPQAPARYYVECIYSAGYMEFTFLPEITSMHIVLSNEDVPVWEGDITPESPSVAIPILYGEYEVTCVTDDGREFGGTIYFEE